MIGAVVTFFVCPFYFLWFRVCVCMWFARARVRRIGKLAQCMTWKNCSKTSVTYSIDKVLAPLHHLQYRLFSSPLAWAAVIIINTTTATTSFWAECIIVLNHSSNNKCSCFCCWVLLCASLLDRRMRTNTSSTTTSPTTTAANATTVDGPAMSHRSASPSVCKFDRDASRRRKDYSHGEWR